MSQNASFDLREFTPYLLAQAAEMSSLGFQRYYKARYAMLRTEWRALFHLGRYGAMTSKTICDRAHIHKTKVSRAVKALEAKRFLTRAQVEHDRRNEMLDLTGAGRAAYRDLCDRACDFDAALLSDFSDDEIAILRRCLTRIARFD